MNHTVFSEATLLLPDFGKVDGTRYAAIACDQFTSEPEYWEKAAAFVGDAPSTLRMILPECYLAEREARVPAINAEMARLLSADFFTAYPDSLLYLARTLPDGRVRHGLVGKVDLEAYGFLPSDAKPIRATEGTVLDRIPPRAQIRRDAPIEFPHVMLLIDDRADKVFAPLKKRSDAPLYSFPLMEGGGAVKGYLLGARERAAVKTAIASLALTDREGRDFLFAVGDGNHSLATAKACYEELKEKIGAEAAACHPARYALVEVVNLHDEALDFEPIYRIVVGADREDLMAAFIAYTEKEGDPTLPPADYRVLFGDEECTLTLASTHIQPVGTLQKFLDLYLTSHPEVEVDYIHDEGSLAALAAREGAVGFLFRGMQKEDLFPAVLAGGPLPRKTFSMGHAKDKRYYLEARAIRE